MHAEPGNGSATRTSERLQAAAINLVPGDDNTIPSLGPDAILLLREAGINRRQTRLLTGERFRYVRIAVGPQAPTLQQRGLNPYQGVLQAIWSDERIASACVAMLNTDQVNQDTDAARRFEPMKQTEIHELRAALLDAGPIMCAACDGRCGRSPAHQTICASAAQTAFR